VRAVVQRVSRASVKVEGKTVGSCGPGLLVLVGAHKEDTEQSATKLADRIAGLRIFNDEEGKINLSLDQIDNDGSAQVLAVSNFTVYGDAHKSRRPSFMAAAPYDEGERLYNTFVSALRDQGLNVEEGTFGAMMEVDLLNDGPVTLVIDC